MGSGRSAGAGTVDQFSEPGGGVVIGKRNCKNGNAEKSAQRFPTLGDIKHEQPFCQSLAQKKQVA